MLPAGGHVEPGEEPAACARREAFEELGLTVALADAAVPLFLTVTETVGEVLDRHTDVSLWFVVPGDRNVPSRPDRREVVGTRWWPASELAGADPQRFDPHLGRFLANLEPRPSRAQSCPG